MRNLLIVKFVILLLALAFVTESQLSLSGCIEYQNSTCIRCSAQTHLYRGLCYVNMIGCLEYSGPFQCVECDPSISQLSESQCVPLVGSSFSREEYKYQLYKYAGSDSRFGDSRFSYVPLSSVQNQPSYININQKIRRSGEYDHFLSQSTQTLSVAKYIQDDVHHYRMLYQGTGQAIFLLIAKANKDGTNLKIQSFVPIAVSFLVNNCIDYDQNRCIKCIQGFHLEQGRCFYNLPQCQSYIQNICLECLDNYLLIENRCISSCESTSDQRSILYYNTNRYSTLESYTGISINVFFGYNYTSTTYTSTGLSSSSSFTSTGSSSIGGGSSSGSSNAGNSQSSSSTSSTSSSSTQGGITTIVNRTTITTTTTTNGAGGINLQGFASGIQGLSSGANSGSSGTSFSGSGSSSSSSSFSSSSSSGSLSGQTTNTSLQGNFINLTSINKNCLQINSNGQCTSCAPTSRLADNGVCVSLFCSSYELQTGLCTGCFAGYSNVNGQCVITRN